MPNFQYCLNASTIRTTPILDQIVAAAEAGYVAIELWHDKIDEHLQEGGSLEEIRAALEDHDLTVPTTISLPNWFDTTGDEYAAAIEHCKRLMGQAAEIGALHIIASPPQGIANYDLGAQHYRELLEIGCAMGVKPAMEFLGFVQQLNTIEDALEVMGKSRHAEATMILDPFHVFRGGGSVESITKLKESQIAICHFNDTPSNPPREQQHDRNRVMPGDGHLDLKRYVELLNQIGYQRYLSLELFKEDLWSHNPIKVAKIGLNRMREVVEG